MSKKKVKRSTEARSLELEEEPNMVVAEIGEDKFEETIEIQNKIEVANITTETTVSNSVTVEINNELKPVAVDEVAKVETVIEEKQAQTEIKSEETKVEIKEEVKNMAEIIVEKQEETTTTVQVENTEVKQEEVKEVMTSEIVAEKKGALNDAKQKFREAVTKSLDEELAKVENMEVISSQFNKSSDFVQNMLKRLEEHLEVAGVKGRNRVETVVDGVFGDNIVNDITTKTLGFVGEKIAQGYTLGTAPAVAVGGAVRGVYKKIVD